MNQQTLQGRWHELKGRLKERWGQLTSDELQQVGGNYEELVGLIQRKTGEGRDQIERYLDDISSGGYEQMKERGREYYAQAAESFQQGYDQVAQRARSGYHDAEEMIRKHPGQSLAVVFGLGLLAGLGFALLSRSR